MTRSELLTDVRRNNLSGHQQRDYHKTITTVTDMAEQEYYPYLPIPNTHHLQMYDFQEEKNKIKDKQWKPCLTIFFPFLFSFNI